MVQVDLLAARLPASLCASLSEAGSSPDVWAQAYALHSRSAMLDGSLCLTVTVAQATVCAVGDTVTIVQAAEAFVALDLLDEQAVDVDGTRCWLWLGLETTPPVLFGPSVKEPIAPEYITRPPDA